MIPARVLLFFSILAVLVSSCASSYKAINPSSLNFPDGGADSNFSYKYNVLKQANNKKLARKEDKTQIRVVAIKIINNTGKTLKYGYNYKIYSGNTEVPVLPISEVTSSINQSAPIYLFYLLLTPARFYVSTETTQSSTPIGYVLGPGLAALNVGIAAAANKNFKKEMEANNILDKEIRIGETAYGMIGIRNTDYAPLSLKIINN